jgi:hypothetical protein
MDLKDQDPPSTNPIIAMSAVQKTYMSREEANLPIAQSNSLQSWKYAAPKTGESETKWVKKTDGTEEKCLRCGHKQCKRWTLSHGTEGHGQKDPTSTSQKTLKAEDMKLQSSLKTFLASTKESQKQLCKKDCQQLQALLTTMHHSEESDVGSVNSD